MKEKEEGPFDLYDRLNGVLKNIENVLGEWAGVSASHCPKWAADLKGIQYNLEDVIRDAKSEWSICK